MVSLSNHEGVARRWCGRFRVRQPHHGAISSSEGLMRGFAMPDDAECRGVTMRRWLPVLSVLVGAVATAPTAAAQSPDGTFGSNQRFLPRDGEVLFRSICQGCHMPDARGATGAGKFPALAKNDKLEAGGYPVFIVVNGQKGMPGFGDVLDDEQVAAVVNYVRSHFGNDYQDKVTPEDVKAVR
jgi:mono/diheme cytochrome c family protein